MSEYHDSRQAQADKIVQLLAQHGHYPFANAVCLDVGCGPGIITNSVSNAFRLTIGLEISEAIYSFDKSARKALVHVIRGDSLSLPLRDQSVDVAICAQVYEHVTDDARLVDEIYRVLMPGGIVFFSGPNFLYPIELHYFLPFLHWLPERLSKAYLAMSRGREVPYERAHPRSFWSLKRLLKRFVIHDVGIDVISGVLHSFTKGTCVPIHFIPDVIWRVLMPWLPNFNWILRKPRT